MCIRDRASPARPARAGCSAFSRLRILLGYFPTSPVRSFRQTERPSAFHDPGEPTWIPLFFFFFQSQPAQNAFHRMGHDWPVLVLRGPMGGPGAPARRGAPHARYGLPHGALESVEQHLLQRPPGQGPRGLSPAAVPRHVADRHLHRSCRLPGLPHPDARDPLATLAERPLPPVSYTHLRAHETPEHLVCRLLLEKKKKKNDT